MMKNYADKQGRFIGGSNHGQRPDGTMYETENAPESATDVFDCENDKWVPAADANQPASLLCQGLTKAGTMCKHKATHGAYCRQHVGQQA